MATARSVIVTGSTGYFGKYLTEALTKDFDRVLAFGRNAEKLEATFGHLPTVDRVVCDLNDLEGIEAIVERIGREHRIHGLINNAYELSPKTGFNTPGGRLEQLSVDVVRHALDTGLAAPLLLTKAVGVHMVEQKIPGSIINISSMYGTVSPSPKLYEGKTLFNPITYGMAKSALNAMTRYVASFWGAHGIRCNSVACGPFPNTETVTANSTRDEEFLQRLKDRIVTPDFGHPRDLVGIVRLLLSDDSRFITGQTIGVDGGWTIV
jgi:gluconate 5-dehydrogenase